MATIKQHFEIHINAPVAKVWDTMLEKETYRQWTKPFNENSDYEGSWDKGARIKFIDGEGNGMVSEIADNQLHTFLSICHLGMINDGIVDTESEEVKKWAPAYENYTFTEQDGGTLVQVDMEIVDEYAKMFEDMWPKALQKLKELAEA